MAQHPSEPARCRGWCRGPAGGRSGRPGAALRDRLAILRAVPAPRTEERQMSVFTVDLKNQPGELARLCAAIAGRGVNLILCATTRGEDGTVAFIADDEASAEAALADAGICCRPAIRPVGDRAAVAAALRSRRRISHTP